MIKSKREVEEAVKRLPIQLLVYLTDYLNVWIGNLHAYKLLLFTNKTVEALIFKQYESN